MHNPAKINTFALVNNFYCLLRRIDETHITVFNKYFQCLRTTWG